MFQKNETSKKIHQKGSQNIIHIKKLTNIIHKMRLTKYYSQKETHKNDSQNETLQNAHKSVPQKVRLKKQKMRPKKIIHKM